jgi:hypothetical protein
MCDEVFYGKVGCRTPSFPEAHAQRECRWHRHRWFVSGFSGDDIGIYLDMDTTSRGFGASIDGTKEALFSKDCAQLHCVPTESNCSFIEISSLRSFSTCRKSSRDNTASPIQAFRSFAVCLRSGRRGCARVVKGILSTHKVNDE